MTEGDKNEIRKGANTTSDPVLGHPPTADSKFKKGADGTHDLPLTI
jgi:hypothetical protein